MKQLRRSLAYLLWEIVWWPWLKVEDYRFNRMMRQHDKRNRQWSKEHFS